MSGDQTKGSIDLGKIQEFQDVTAVSLGVELAGGCMTSMITMIPKHTKIPVKVISNFNTFSDKKSILSIFKGEDLSAANKKELGMITYPPGKISVLLTTEVNSLGMLKVVSENSGSGMCLCFKVETERISKESLERLIDEEDEL